MAREPFFPRRDLSGIFASASKNAVLPNGFTAFTAATTRAVSSVNETTSRTAPSAKTKSAKSSPGIFCSTRALTAARAPASFPARPIDPDPSRRIVNETGASSLRAKRSVFTGVPSTSRVTSCSRRLRTGSPLRSVTTKGTRT